MLTLFGGSVVDLTPMLNEERFSDNWEPRIRSRYGLTMGRFNGTVIPVEMGVNTKRIEKLEAETRAQAQDGSPGMAQETV